MGSLRPRSKLYQLKYILIILRDMTKTCRRFDSWYVTDCQHELYKNKRYAHTCYNYSGLYKVTQIVKRNKLLLVIRHFVLITVYHNGFLRNLSHFIQTCQKSFLNTLLKWMVWRTDVWKGHARIKRVFFDAVSKYWWW